MGKNCSLDCENHPDRAWGARRHRSLDSFRRRRCACHLRSSPSSAHLAPTASQSARQRKRQSSCRSAPCSHAAFRSRMSSSDHSFPSLRSRSKGSEGRSRCLFCIASSLLVRHGPYLVYPNDPAELRALGCMVRTPFYSCGLDGRWPEKMRCPLGRVRQKEWPQQRSWGRRAVCGLRSTCRGMIGTP
jgi:hypothetical protein